MLTHLELRFYAVIGTAMIVALALAFSAKYAGHITL